MAAMPQAWPPDEVEYPSSDGEPMAETDRHWTAMTDLALALKDRYAGREDVYVASNLFVYYEEGRSSAVFAPDVFVVLGAPPHARRTYRLWQEPAPPTVVFEVTSRSTWLEDRGNKRALCESLGVAEYWLFDPDADVLVPPLQGLRLGPRGYHALAPDAEGRIHSEVLGLRMWVDEGLRLRLADAETGVPLRPPLEEAEHLRRENARLRAALEEAQRGRDSDTP